MAYSLIGSLLRRPVAGILLIGIGAVGLTLSILNSLFWCGTASAFAVIYGAWVVWNIERRLTRRLALMIEAIGNNDYTMRFGGRWAMGDERTFNESLSKLADVMRAEKLAVAQQDYYHALVLDVVRTGIVAVTADGFVRQVNAEALRTLGLGVLTHIKQMGNIVEGMDAELMQMVDGESRHISFSRDGQEAHLLIRAASASLRGKEVKIFAIDNIRSSLDAQELDSWIRLSHVLTHEIMNSMAPMVSLSQTLMSACDGDASADKVRDGLSVIHDTAGGLVRFVESFRRFTSLPTPAPQLIGVGDLVEDVTKLFEAEGDGPKLSSAVEPDDLMIYADPALIRQVLTNVVKNARQAIMQSGEGTEVRIKAWTEGDVVTIEVANDGPSIADDVAQQIFVPFFTTKAGGSGIGLSVSRQIMRLSHGSLTLRRDAEGRFKTAFLLRFE